MRESKSICRRCMVKRNKYQSLTIERKLGIIDEVDSLPSGKRIPYAGFFRGRTIHKLLENKFSRRTFS